MSSPGCFTLHLIFLYPFSHLWASLVAQLVKNLLQFRRTRFDSWIGKICWKRDRLPTPVFLGFSDSTAGKESTRSVADLGLIPGLQRSLREESSYELQYSCLENCLECIIHIVTKSQTWLSNFHFHCIFLLAVDLYTYILQKFANCQQKIINRN